MPIEKPAKNQKTNNNNVATIKTTALNLNIAHIAIKEIITGMTSGTTPKCEISEKSRVLVTSFCKMSPFT